MRQFIKVGLATIVAIGLAAGIGDHKKVEAEVSSEKQQAINMWFQVLKYDDNINHRINAAHELGNLHDKSAVPGLSEALRDDSEPSVREAVAYALGAIRDKSAIPALSAALKVFGEFDEDLDKDVDAGMREGAAWALGRIGNKSVIPVLGEVLLGDPEPSVRIAAAKALGKIDDKRALVPLKKALKSSIFDWERPYIMKAIADIKSKIPKRIPSSEEAITSEVKQEPTVEEAQLLFTLGQNYERNKCYALALKQYQKIIEKYPETGWAKKAKQRILKIKQK